MIEKLIKKSRETGNFSELEKFCLSPEFQNLSYAEKNEHFMTSSKIKMFMQCEWSYKLKFIDRVPSPIPEPDYFIIGRAFDDIMTYDKEYFDARYVVVDSRMDIDATIEKCKLKIQKSKTLINKDGSRSKTGEKMELEATQKIEYVKKMEGKTQITLGMWETIENMMKEFGEQTMFNHKPVKRVMFFDFPPFLLKVELDDFDGKVIRDMKTSANILTFDPEMYIVQAGVYQWIVEENIGEKLDVELEVVDKYTHFSRSDMWRFKNSTLLDGRKRAIEALWRIQKAHDTGIYMPTSNRKTLFSSEYYGHDGYGRPTQPNVY